MEEGPSKDWIVVSELKLLKMNSPDKLVKE